jgi:ABC-type sugar transport system ATPase subunit
MTTGQEAVDPPALEVRGVTKRFGQVLALDRVDLVARRGAVHALVGENGAGKSTLTKILAGALRADAGELLLGGRPRAFASPSQALAAGVAMISQELSLAPDMTVAENVFLGREPRGRLPGTVSPRRMADQTAAIAEEHGFVVDPAARVDRLSAADCQVVEILRALAREASVIVMDEPTSSLGRDEARALLAAVRRLRDRGATIIYISHRLEEVVELADDVTVLRDGRVAHSGPAAALGVAEIVRHMVGRELTEYYPPREGEKGGVRLRVEGLSTAAGVSGVSFEVRAGEVVGVAGLVGSGRSALVRALAGVDRPRAGAIAFDGEPVALAGPADAIARGFMVVTEDRKRTGLCLDLPAAWNVTLPCLARLGMRRWLDLRRERALVSELGARLGVRWAGPDAPAASLSGGNQQKLLLARALLADSQLVVLDEPTRGVDIAARADIYALLRELAAGGKAVLVVSSELPELLGVTDRILVMRRGRLAGRVETARTTQEEVMRLAAVDAAPEELHTPCP